jgi:hypothetical protein
MMLNALATLSDTIKPAEIARIVRVLCFDQYSCEFVAKAGFQVAAGGIPTAVLAGFNAGVARKGNWLDDYCLAREQALLHLLAEGALVMRTDNDVCFTANPFEIQARLAADILVTAQPLKPDFEGGMWSYNWQCNSSLAPLPLTLNNGVIIINGSKLAIRQLYGQAYGLGVKLLALNKNGWAQRGFNAVLHYKGLCLNQVGSAAGFSAASSDTTITSAASNSTTVAGSSLSNNATSVTNATNKCAQTSAVDISSLTGQLPDNSTLATIDVSSPCEPCSLQRNNAIIHANCLGNRTDTKLDWLRKIGCWRLPESWNNTEYLTGNATQYLEQLLKVQPNITSTISTSGSDLGNSSSTSLNQTQAQ